MLPSKLSKSVTFHRSLSFDVWRLGLAILAWGSFHALQAQEIDFNRQIRPILSENCFYCHGQDGNHREADLRLDAHAAAADAGVLSPGQPDESELIRRILLPGTDEEVMPPSGSNRKLSSGQIELLIKWIAQGAKYQEHWAYEPLIQPSLPQVDNDAWAQSPIDYFVLEKLSELHLPPSDEAPRSVLIKRLYADLLGIPPTVEEVDEYLADDGSEAYERLVDRVMAKPQYGERVALPWLDAARYADSNGFQQDGDHWQWIWRDWVVRALNDDLTFDQFTIWQLAGDLLPNATDEQKIASAFNRNHMLNGEGGAIPEEQRWVNLFDRMDTTATTWLGLTMACCQCHDHKYDPITMQDYYSLLEGFNRVPEKGVPTRFSTRIRIAPPFLELPTAENQQHIDQLEKRLAELDSEIEAARTVAMAGWKAGITENGKLDTAAPGLKEAPKSLQDLLAQSERTEEQQKQIEVELKRFFNSQVFAKLTEIPVVRQESDLRKELDAYKADQIPRVMVMSDESPRETFVLSRGDYLSPLDQVQFDTPKFLPELPADYPRNRLGFAQWLMLPEHPLTARVQVNRVWQYFFGQGIVKTPEDFGVQSEYPIHKDLLDWLSVEFRDSGWSVKALHRQIVLSATYRQSSQVSKQALALDPENRYYGRASRFRMPALVLRDWALAASGLLVNQLKGAPVYPYQPDAVWESLSITKERDFTYPKSSDQDLYRRSLYTFWRRTVGPANMFDTSNRQTCQVRTAITSTPLHALTTLNDETWVEAARTLALRCTREWPDDFPSQLQMAVRLVLCRSAAPKEIQVLTAGFERQLKSFASDPAAVSELLECGESNLDQEHQSPELAALTVTCLTLFNLDEALTRE
ncbi:MAG: PSD1 domain-containing protein [Planctomycetales bacterium]|nr:PSD1 domain-containing protein [Planctomycetales bacterium]